MAAALGAEHKLECKSMVLRLHTLFDIPRDLVSLDSRRENVELVLKPTAKYYSENKRFCKLDLPEQYVPFSPSSIIFKGDRFVLDFCSAPPQSGLTFTRATVPHRAASFANSIPTTSANAEHGGSTTASNNIPGTPGVASSTGKMNLPSESDVRGTAGGVPKPRMAFGEAAEEDHEVNMASPGPSKLKVTGNTAVNTPAGAVMSNQIVLRYPTRSDLKVIIEVMVGARQRRHDSSAVRWITPSWADRSIPGTISTFAAADGEVMRHKLVNRFVGLTVGHLSCTMELPYATEDLREVLSFKPNAITEAADRLCDDYIRMLQYHDRADEEVLTLVRKDRELQRELFVERLKEGVSEMAIHCQLLKEVTPKFFVRRIRRICTMYPPTPQSSAWVRTDPATLAAEHAGREMELIRSLCAELGPDLSAISPRNRFLSYTNVQPLGEELWRWIREKFANQENDILDYEPDVFMESLARQYGTPEPTPIQYGFPPISYELDRRAYFCDWLRFPVNREHHRYRDEALAARQGRVPLQLTPNERPLHPIRPTSRNVGEIDILLEKYKPEFVQIVPSIADAMESVTQQNERLLQRLLRDAQAPPALGAGPVSGTRDRMRSLPYEVCPHGFHMFQSERATGSYVALLNRFAEYTYISPSTLLSAVIYLDRLCWRHPRLLLTPRNIEKLLVAAVRVASKVVDLRSVNNKNFANVFSLMIQDMNDLESEFLKLMGFDFFLSPKEFDNYAHLVQLPAAYLQMSSSLRHSTTTTGGAAVADRPGDTTRSGESAVAQVGDATHEVVVAEGGGGNAARSETTRSTAEAASGNPHNNYGGGTMPPSDVPVPSASTAAAGAAGSPTTRIGGPVPPSAPPPRASSSTMGVIGIAPALAARADAASASGGVTAPPTQSQQQPQPSPSSQLRRSVSPTTTGGSPPRVTPAGRPAVVSTSSTTTAAAQAAGGPGGGNGSTSYANSGPSTAAEASASNGATAGVAAGGGSGGVVKERPSAAVAAGVVAGGGGAPVPSNGYGANGNSSGGAVVQAEYVSGARPLGIA